MIVKRSIKFRGRSNINNFTLTVVFFCVLVLVNCQDYGFDDFPNYAFSGGFDAPSQNVRDPRNDRGPVIFPQVPLDNGQGSGVIAGASGYGFVPPRQGSRSSSLY